uniref:DNA topoisomerase n=1 Tax=Strongyloides venezuelensis TaxID=75913 RepID=A0A0K0G0Q1_STRVS
MFTKVLFVAEKNDAAKSISNVLSHGNCSRREGMSKFNKIYEFDTEVLGRRSRVSATSVSGHLMTTDFGPEYQNWVAVDTVSLFEAPITSYVVETMKNIETTLRNCSRVSSILVIWTDCDREGENIGAEIARVCSTFNENIDIYRARFSEITPHAIRHALNNLTRLNENIVNAVDCRIELDLRIGAAFTRLQTLYLQRRFSSLLTTLVGDFKSVISYGSCQFPTLGFIVDRYLHVKDFIPENFWKLRAFHLKNGVKTEFTWERGKLFYKSVVESFLAICQNKKSMAKIAYIERNPKTKFRPVAMDTICLEKLAVRVLKMSAKKAMDMAEKLYSSGYISYPRTETNIFPRNFNLPTLVENQKDDPNWGPFAEDIMNRGGPRPRNGKKSDEAHPPIHPLKLVRKEQLQNHDMYRLYELIVRYFLACCSRDAKGQETTVTMTIDEEIFKAYGLQIEDRGYLEVYPYDKWADKILPEYIVNEKVSENLDIDIHEGTTTSPPLLNEADLISLMDKYGIGTDATHAEHIETIQKRRYCSLNNERRFVPSALGLALVQSYNYLGYQLSKPDLRADLERGLEAICKGEKTKEEVLSYQVLNYKRIFEAVEGQIERFGDFFEGEAKNNNVPLRAIENNFPSSTRDQNVNTSTRGGRGRSGSTSARGRGSSTTSSRNSSTSRNQRPNSNPRVSEEVKCHCNKPSMIYTCQHSIASYVFLALEGVQGNDNTTLIEKVTTDDGMDGGCGKENDSIVKMDDKNVIVEIIRNMCKDVYDYEMDKIGNDMSD